MSATVTGPFDLGTLPDGTLAVANGVSADGTTIVGYADDASGFFHAFRWTIGTGMVDLGVLSGDVASIATAVSGDGSVVVGYSQPDLSHSHAFRWDAINGLVSLSAAAYAQAFAVSRDGASITGASGATSSSVQLFRYKTLGGFSNLGSAPHATGGTLGKAISDDGLTIAGASGAVAAAHAFLWRDGGSGFTDIGIRPGATASFANGITGDGVTVVGGDGFSSNAGEQEAWSWTLTDGFNDAGFILGNVNPDAACTCITGDGTAMAGTSSLLTGEHRTGWYGTTQFGGLVVLGIPQLSTGPGSNTTVNGISDDGLTLVGESDDGGTAHAVYWIVVPDVPPAAATPVNLPVPPPYPMPKVPPLVICLASTSHAAGMFYGPHVALPRARRS